MIVQGLPKERSSQSWNGLSSDGKSVFEQLHSHEEMKIVHIYLCFLVRLHLTIDRYHRYGGSWIFEEFPVDVFEDGAGNYPGFGKRVERICRLLS